MDALLLYQLLFGGTSGQDKKERRAIAIRELYAEGMSVEQLAEKFDLSERHIRQVVGVK